MLEVRKLEACYGLSQALFDVNLEIAKGEMIALLGRNGMGKTTTIQSILRLTLPKGGNVKFLGKNLKGMKPHTIARMGIGLVPEGRRCFTNLTVYENLTVTQRKGNWDNSKVLELFPSLAERSDQLAGTLSGGEQQMLAIGRALMTNPKLLILDEATEGLAPIIRQQIWASLKFLLSEGMSILIVDKMLKDLIPLASGAVILENGRTVWSGFTPDLSQEIFNRYLGV